MPDRSVFNDPIAFGGDSTLGSDALASQRQPRHAATVPPTVQNETAERLDLTPEHLQPEQIDLQCPRCHLALRRGVLYERWEVCGCGECGGFVVPRRSFQEMIRELRAAYTGPDDRPSPMDPAQLDVHCQCPGCRQPMKTHPYYGPGNSVIDSCSGCGVTWLDATELVKLIRAPGRRDDNVAPSAVKSAFAVGSNRPTAASLSAHPLTAALQLAFSRPYHRGFRLF